MKKIILILVIVGMAIAGQSQIVYTETSSDSITIVNEWHFVNITLNAEKHNLKVKGINIQNVYIDNVLSMKTKLPKKFTFNENDTLFKVKRTSDSTYILKDTFLVKPVYDRITSTTRERLLKKALTYFKKSDI